MAIFHSEGISPLSQEIFINLIKYFFDVSGPDDIRIGRWSLPHDWFIGFQLYGDSFLVLPG